MSPPISATPWREVGENGIRVDNQYIPAGCEIGVSMYSFHHNEDIFPDSYTFKPERWIESAENPKETLERARHTFNPFSVGRHSCVGRNFAYIEMMDTLARTMFYLDFRRTEGPLASVGEGDAGAKYGRHRIDEFQLREHITCSHQGPFLEFRRREGVSL